jgi:YD repeat-containing protein
MSEVNTILTEPYKGWSTAAGGTVYVWVVNANSYDIDGRSVKAWQATYIDGSTSNPHPLSVTVISAQSANGTQPATPDQITVNATASTSTPPTLTSYTPDGQTLTTTDQYNGVTTNIYDASGHLIETQYPDGTDTISVYDTLGRVILATDKFVPGQSAPILATRTVYDSLGQTIATQRVSGVSITVSPDPSYGSLFAITAVTGAGLINSNQTDPAEGTWSLDLSGNWAVNAATPAYYSQSQTVYDAQGQAVETDSPSGLRTGTVYYPDGSVEYMGPLNPSASSAWYLSANPLPLFSSYTASLYDQAANLPSSATSVGAVSYSSITDALSHTTETFVDSSGRTVETLYSDGSFTQTIYSVGDQANSGYAVYGIGAALVVPAGGSETVTIAQHVATDANPPFTIDVYDAAGNLVDVYEPAVADALNGGAMTSPHWHYVYDASGNETIQISPTELPAYTTWLAGSQTTPFTGGTSFAYDASGNKICETLPDGEMQTWAYDQYGNQTLHKVYSATNHTTALQTTWDIYSIVSDGTGGRLLGEYRYNSDFTPTGSTLSYADSMAYAEKTLYHYDSMGRQSEVDDYTSAGGATPVTFTQYTYDPITGKQASITTPEGTVNYVYDPVTGELIETWTGTVKASAGTDILYGYDNQGRLESVSQLRLDGQGVGSSALPSASQIAYNATGGVVNTYDPTTLYSYDAAGNLKSVSDPNGQNTSYTYDGLNRLTDELVTIAGGTIDVFREHYDLNDNGSRNDAIDTRYTGTTANTVFSQIEYQWGYDADQRLASEVLTVQTGGANAPAPYANAFSYDLANNRTDEYVNQTQSQLKTGDTIAGGDTISYTYNHDDQLWTETELANGSITPVYSLTYTYDANGDLWTETGTGSKATSNTYTYDLQNRMTKAVINGTETDYGYDTSGVLVGEGSPGDTQTYYLNDPNNPTGYTKAIEDKSGISPSNATTIRSYVLGLKVEAQSDWTNGTLYMVTDGHGSTTAVVNTAGQVIEQYSYDAYGKMLLAQRFSYSGGTVTSIVNITNAPTATTWLFGGDGVYDPATGWTYHLARWTSGFWFTQADGEGYGSNADPISPNKYLYAGGNPVNGWDPSGHYTQAFGNAAHDVIGAAYLETHPGSIINPTTYVLTSLKPDIFDAANDGYAEIKPLSFPGITGGLVQILTYDRAYGENGFLHLGYHRITNWPVSPTLATVVAADGETDEIAYFNVDGLIFYTNLVEDYEDLKQLRNPSDLYRFLRESIKNQFENIKDTAQNLVKRLLPEEGAEIDSTIAEDTLEDL